MTVASIHAERHSRRSFTAQDVCAVAGITYRQLDYWTRTGLVHASGHATTGHGDARWYRDTDVLRICVIAEMLKVGFGLAAIRQDIDTLVDGGVIDTPNVIITVDVDRLRAHVERYRRAAS
jgi:DNA-binding transcriptional MerR regulator